jgi:hypothetical protein
LLAANEVGGENLLAPDQRLLRQELRRVAVQIHHRIGVAAQLVRNRLRLCPHVAEVGRRVVHPIPDAGGRSAGSALLHLVAEEVAAIVNVIPVALLADRNHGAHLRGHELDLALQVRHADLRQRRIYVDITGSRRVHIV